MLPSETFWRRLIMAPVNKFGDSKENLTLDCIHYASEIIRESDLVVRTPLWKDCHKRFLKLGSSSAFSSAVGSFRLHLKLENSQITGSFKIRGVVTQLAAKAEMLRKTSSAPITMSAGNYGKAFAHALSGLEGVEQGVVIMPDDVPSDRVDLIRGLGCKVEQVPKSALQQTVDSHVTNSGKTYLHSFDDVELMAGHGSLGLEILEDCNPDIVLICCGGGGLLAGAAAGIQLKLNGARPCSVYGVEPEGAATMYESFRRGNAFALPEAKSVASGLSPPYAGALCYAQCLRFVKDILLVSDADLKEATAILYRAGIVAEPAGAAAFAALVKGKVPEDLKGKEICVVVTGGNVSTRQMVQVTDDVGGCFI